MGSATSYLITGGLGLIGSGLANYLTGKITILSRSDRHKDRLKRSDAKILIKTLDDVNSDDIQDIDVIFHCASTVDNYNVLTDPYIDSHTNIDGSIRLLELCKEKSQKPKFIYLSTFFVYGNTYDKTRIPINEESKTDPLAIYSATKLCTESIVKLYAKLYDIPYIIVRLTNVYGENEEYDNRKKGALNYLIMNAIHGKQINLYRGGNFYRDYIYVDDVVRALAFLEKKTANDLFLVGYGKPTKFLDMIDYILDNTGRKSKVVEVKPPRFHSVVGITNFIADISKVNAIGWKSTIDYKEGIGRIIRYYSRFV